MAKLNQRAAILSIIIYLILSVLKFLVGYFANSEALTADGLNNSTDILASFALLIGLRYSLKPADLDHPYGHRRAETISSIVASFIMFAVGLQVLFSSGESIWLQKSHQPEWIAVWVSLLCAVIMFFVYKVNSSIAKKTHSLAVLAAAKDNLSDAIVSVGAAIGIIGSQFGMPWFDSLTALIVGIIICKTAWDIFKEATHMLTDGIDVELLDQIKLEIAQVIGVSQVLSLKGRAHGRNLLLDVDILVDPNLSVKESHHITETIEEKLKGSFHISHIQIHVEPH
jgi:cation diffusion facilitator family transporter